MRLQKRLPALLGTGLLLVPSTCFAAAGAQALSLLVRDHIITQALTAFWGISWAAMFYYAIRMILDSHKDSALTDMANTSIHAFTGFAVIASAATFASAFWTNSLSGSAMPGVNPSLLNVSIIDVTNFMIGMSAGIFVLMVVVAGLRMLATQGEQGEFDKWRHVLVANCVGVGLMLLAGAIVNGVWLGDAASLIAEMRGIAEFLLMLIGFASVIVLIIAGIYLIISIDQSYQDKAKKIIIGTLITLVVVFALHALMLTFLP